MGVIVFADNWVNWTRTFVGLRESREKYKWRWRFLWAVIIVGATVGFAIQSAFLIEQYLRYGRTTNLKINYQGQLPFPSVTVCSVNPFKRSELNASKDLADLVNAYDYTASKKRSSNTIVLNRKKRQSTGCASGVTITNGNNGSLVYEMFNCTNYYVLTLYCDNSKRYPRNLTMNCDYNSQKVSKFQNQAWCWIDWCSNQGSSSCEAACGNAIYNYACVSQRDEYLKADVCDQTTTSTETTTTMSSSSSSTSISTQQTSTLSQLTTSEAQTTVEAITNPENTTPMTSIPTTLLTSMPITTTLTSSSSSADYSTSTSSDTTLEIITEAISSSERTTPMSSITTTILESIETSTSTSSPLASTSIEITSSDVQSTTEMISTNNIPLTSTLNSESISSTVIDIQTTSEPEETTTTSNVKSSTNIQQESTLSSTFTQNTMEQETTDFLQTTESIPSTQKQESTLNPTTMQTTNQPTSFTTVQSTSSTTFQLTSSPAVSTELPSTLLTTNYPSSSSTVQLTSPTSVQSTSSSTVTTKLPTKVESSSTSTKTSFPSSPSTQSKSSSVTSKIPVISTNHQSEIPTTSTQLTTKITPIETTKATTSTATRQFTSTAVPKSTSLLIATLKSSKSSPQSSTTSTALPKTITSSLSSKTIPITTTISSSQPTSMIQKLSSSTKLITTEKYSSSSQPTSSTTLIVTSQPQNLTSLMTTTTLSISTSTTTKECSNSSCLTISINTAPTTQSSSSSQTNISTLESTILTTQLTSTEKTIPISLPSKITSIAQPTISDRLTSLSSTTTEKSDTSTFASVHSTESTAQANQQIADAYQLTTSSNSASLGAKMDEALINVAATLTPEQRDQLAYSLSEMVPSCIFDQQACDMQRDFSQVYDVDYGYCYTFNLNSSYITTQTGSLYGLQMILYNNVSDYLPNTEEVGFKVVVHGPEHYPFPNTEGHFVAVGTQANFVAVKSDFTRLDKPYGHCDTLDSIKKRGMSFYYAGNFSTEGCLRSSYQDSLVKVCGCADSRFPYKGSDVFCSPLDKSKYACYQNYVSTNGDYGNVNCTCHTPCEETSYTSRMSHGRWPSGQFFEEAYCPLAEQMGLDCREFYSENAARLLVYYGALTWESLDEVPTVSLLRLFNEMSGNLGLWLGLTAVTLGELFLVFIQSSLWCCRCKRELPDVPSFYRPNYPLASPHFDALTSRSSSISPPSTVATNEMLTTGNAMKFNNWLIVGEEQVIIDDLLEFPISTHYNSFTLLQY